MGSSLEWAVSAGAARLGQTAGRSYSTLARPTGSACGRAACGKLARRNLAQPALPSPSRAAPAPRSCRAHASAARGHELCESCPLKSVLCPQGPGLGHGPGGPRVPQSYGRGAARRGASARGLRCLTPIARLT